MEKQVDSGTMKLVDEKKALAEISTLRRQKKGFTNLDDLQKRIDEKKAENTELKKTFDNPESRALSQKYEDNQKELDDIKAGREASKSSMDTLRADRDRLYEEQQVTYRAIRAVKDEYYQGKKAFKEHEDQIWQQRREKKAAEDAEWRKGKRQQIAQQKLEEASEPAFLDEIRTAEGLIKHFDPSYGTDDGPKGPSEFAATAQRTIDDSGFKGMKVVKKEDEDFFVGAGGKKKKGKKGAAAESGKFNMNVGIIEELGKVGVDPPSTQADIPNVVEKLKGKLEDWKKNQKEQTEKASPHRSTPQRMLTSDRTSRRPRKRLSVWRRRPMKPHLLLHQRAVVKSDLRRWPRRTPAPILISLLRMSKSRRRMPSRMLRRI